MVGRFGEWVNGYRNGCPNTCKLDEWTGLKNGSFSDAQRKIQRG